MKIATRKTGGDRYLTTDVSNGRNLVFIEFNLADRHIVLAFLLGNGAGHRAHLGAIADVAVILLGVLAGEVIDDFLVAVLDLDDRLALVGFLQIALGTGDRALEGLLLLLVLGANTDDEAEKYGQPQQNGPHSLHFCSLPCRDKLTSKPASHTTLTARVRLQRSISGGQVVSNKVIFRNEPTTRR